MIRTALLLSLFLAYVAAFQFNLKGAPVKKAAPVPVKNAAPVPAKKAAPAPLKKAAAVPVKKAAPAPVKKAAPAPVKKAAPVPVKKAVPVPVKKAAPVPVKKAAPAPVKKAAPAPVQRTVKSSDGSLPSIFLTGFPSGYKSTGEAYVSSFAGGLVGADIEAGEFDPFKLSSDVTSETLSWYRAAELKHGRVCMLASLGILTASAIHLPDPVFESTGALAAATKLFAERPAAIWQLLIALAAIETSSLFSNGQGTGGDLGWDPLNFKAKYGLDDPSKLNVMQLKELKNGRLAMITTLALLFQESISGKGVYEQLSA